MTVTPSRSTADPYTVDAPTRAPIRAPIRSASIASSSSLRLRRMGGA
jgi:hypothetical protein